MGLFNLVKKVGQSVYNAGYNVGKQSAPAPAPRPTPAPAPSPTPGFNVLSGNPNAFMQAVRSIQPRPQGQVLGASTYSGGGGGGAGIPSSGAAPQSQSQPSQQNYQDLYQAPPAYNAPDFDSMIAPALQALDEAIGPLQQSYEANVSDINTQKANKLTENTAGITGQQNTLNTAKTQQTQLGENAANEAKRQYAEIQQGLQARYGGTTGTGAFATELAGAQTTRNVANIRQQVSNSMQQIDDKLQQVQEIGRIASLDIEDQARSQLNDAKSRLDAGLSAIRQQKGELQSRKAELAANAIQLYQQTVNQVNAQNAAFKQNLALQMADAQNRLQIAQTKARQTAQSFQTPDYQTYIDNAQPFTDQGLNYTETYKTGPGSKVTVTPKKKSALEELQGLYDTGQ